MRREVERRAQRRPLIVHNEVRRDVHVAHHILPEHVDAVIEMRPDQVVGNVKVIGQVAVTLEIVLFVGPHAEPILSHSVRILIFSIPAKATRQGGRKKPTRQ